MKTPPATLLAVLATALMLGAPGAAAQATIADDSFEVEDHPEGFRTVIASGTGAIQFFTRNAITGTYTPTIVDDAVLGSKALSHVDTTSGAVGNQLIGILPQTIVLAAAGDFIRLELTFRFLNSGSATANSANFRFGIEGANGTFVTADNQPTQSDNDQGYYAQFGTLANTTNNILYREFGGTTPILGGTDRENLLASAGTPALANGDTHTASLTITRGTGSNVTVSLTIDGGTPITGTSATMPFYSFSEIAIGNGFVATPLHANIDDVKVTSNVPEPGTGALALLGLAALAARRRRTER